MRVENALNFNEIREELTNKVVEDIRRWGYSYVHFSITADIDKVYEMKGAFSGWEINKDFRVAAKAHFKNCEFVVTDCVTPGGRLFAYMIEL